MKLVELFLSKRLIKSVLVLLSGTIVAQLVPIVLQPLLRRTYSPEDFGKYALFAAVLEIIVTINTFRLEQAVLIPKDENQAYNLVRTSISTAVFVSLLVVPILPILHYFTGLTYSLLVLLPFCSFFFGLINIGNYWFVRKSFFKKLSFNKLIRRFTEGGFHLVFGFFLTQLGLVLGSLIGFVIAGIHVFYELKLKKFFSWSEYVSVLSEYKSFILYSVFPALLNIISLFIPLFIFKSKFNDFHTGQFDLTRQVLGVPLVIISGTLSQVLVSHVAQRFHNKLKIMDILLKVLILCIGISFLLIFTINNYGTSIIVFIFGEKWKLAGNLSELLVWGYSFKFLSTCFYNVLIPIDKVRILGWWHILNFLISLVLFVPFLTNTITSFCTTYAITEVISCLICVFFVLRSVLKVQNNNLANE